MPKLTKLNFDRLNKVVTRHCTIVQWTNVVQPKKIKIFRNFTALIFSVYRKVKD